MSDNRTQHITHTSRPVRPGISVLLDERRDLLHGRRVGVLTGPSGVLPDLISSASALRRVANVRALFGPEHGLLGAAAPGEHIASGMHPSGVPIYSLYGAHLAQTSEQLADLDLIVCDIQDVGCRFYTYAWTLVKLMESAAAAGVAVIVTDRPNPLGGAIEGPGVDAGHRTLVGLHDVPIRHGLTLGELARLANGEMGLGCDLTVISCEGWRRADRWEATGLPWVAPSPNIPTAATALVFSAVRGAVCRRDLLRRPAACRRREHIQAGPERAYAGGGTATDERGPTFERSTVVRRPIRLVGHALRPAGRVAADTGSDRRWRSAGRDRRRMARLRGGIPRARGAIFAVSCIARFQRRQSVIGVLMPKPLVHDF